MKTAYAFFFLSSSTKNENILKIYICNVSHVAGRLKNKGFN